MECTLSPPSLPPIFVLLMQELPDPTQDSGMCSHQNLGEKIQTLLLLNLEIKRGETYRKYLFLSRELKKKMKWQLFELRVKVILWIYPLLPLTAQAELQITFFLCMAQQHSMRTKINVSENRKCNKYIGMGTNSRGQGWEGRNAMEEEEGFPWGCWRPLNEEGEEKVVLPGGEWKLPTGKAKAVPTQKWAPQFRSEWLSR